jgi:4-hydroxy-2-oxoglutarate aldolase
MSKDLILRFFREVWLSFFLSQYYSRLAWRCHLSCSFMRARSYQVADASPIPIMVYNFPKVTAGLDLDADTITALGAHPNIVGAKFSCGHLGKLTRLVTSFSPVAFAPFIGRSDSFLPALSVDCPGGIMTLANVAPRAHRALWDAWHDGRIDDARDIQRMLAHCDAILSRYGGISFTKALIAREFSYGGATVRGPLVTTSVDRLSSTDATLLNELLAFERSL